MLVQVNVYSKIKMREVTYIFLFFQIDWVEWDGVDTSIVCDTFTCVFLFFQID